MPSFRIHAAAGAAVFLAANAFLYGQTLGSQSAALFAAAFLGAVFPDVDERHTRQFKLILIIASASAFAIGFQAKQIFLEPFAAGLAAAIAVAILVFALKPRHRGIVHTLTAAAAFTAAIYLLRGTECAAAGLLGYLSHLALDKIG
jgi:membrane-bound metal-dependent hydrolase YbcI (DUF457 family)